jgi:uncharacterized protein (DUF302 family)
MALEPCETLSPQREMKASWRRHRQFSSLHSTTVKETYEVHLPADGLMTLRSHFGPQETMDRLEPEVKARGMNVFARIDHSVGAASVGLSLPPTEVLIFGNAKAGTPLMQSVQTIAIDLPLKALVWLDASGDTYLAYNDPAWLAGRHALGNETATVIGNMSVALNAVARAATSLPH